MVIAGLLNAVARPDKLIGIYISWWTMNYSDRLAKLIKEGRDHQINTFVCDFRADGKAYRKNLNQIKKNGYYAIARIVVFEEGKGADYRSAEDSGNWNEKLALIKKAGEIGFNEIQLDYIRFADSGWADPRKKEVVEKFLQEARRAVEIPIGVDVFGSVAYQPHLLIGQDLARMADYIDVVSPMLYPSHFMYDSKRMGHPYETMLEGSLMAKKKMVDKPVKVIPYIQGFAMNMKYSGLSLKDYIKAQMRAVEDAQTDGFFVWEAANNYAQTWAAIREHGRLYQRQTKSGEEIDSLLEAFQATGNIRNKIVALPEVSVDSESIIPAQNAEEKPWWSFLTLGML